MSAHRTIDPAALDLPPTEPIDITQLLGTLFAQDAREVPQV
jgi:hypothetical protein